VALTAASAPDKIDEALSVLGRNVLRHPDSLPFPGLPAGTDTMPGIEHFVVLMMENHSYDNLLGMLGRGPEEELRGDGFVIGPDGLPTATNPYADERVQHAFRMPTTCQLDGKPSQDWEASHIQYAGGRLDGFVVSPSGPVSMGYWTREDLPFTYDLAETFTLGDRWFCSLLGQTDPNRRFLIAATSSGMTDDIGTSAIDAEQDTLLVTPANGTIFDRLSSFGVSWSDYAQGFPTGSTAELYPLDDVENVLTMKTLGDFFTDAASGRLPGFCIVDPNYSTQSQENPQNIVVGEDLMSQVVRAVCSSPAWETTMLVITYDEHGGYYDHVPPPVALAPDLIPPIVQPTESPYEGFTRYGFRVPSIVVSPYSRPGYVTHAVHDHTSILAMVERKWNLPAMTYRDANANDLTDFLDLNALDARTPTFVEMPLLAASGMSPATLACSVKGPGKIPPAGSVSGP